MPTSVLFLTTRLDLGGLEKVVYRLVRDLDRHRFTPIVCCLYDKGEIGEEIERRLGIKVYSDLTSHRFDFGVVGKLVSIIRKEKVRLVYLLNTPLTQFWGTLCAKLAGVPALVSAVHSTKRGGHAKRGLLLDKLTFPLMDGIIALADAHKNVLIQERGASAENVEVIGNGIDLEEFWLANHGNGKREELGIQKGTPLIGVVARLVPGKGLETFLQTVQIVLKSAPQSHFLIAGDGEERSRLEWMASDLSVSSNVHFLGKRDDVADIITLFDVAVLTSDPIFETFPLALLEYMAAAKPVVATRVGSVSEIVVDGQTGFLVPPRDPQATASKILTLLAEPELAQRMGAAGRKRVESEFTTRHMVQKTEDLFKRLLREKGVTET